MFLVKIQAHQEKEIIFNEDGTVQRDESEDGLDNALTQLLVKIPNKKAGGVVLSDEKIASLHEKV